MSENLSFQTPVAATSAEERSDFIWKCYAHVVGAILAFAAIEVYFFTTGIAQAIAAPMLQNWWLVLGAFILVSWGATHVTYRVQSKGAQYAAFAVFIFAEALIFAPMLYMAEAVAPGVIDSAAGITVLGCVGLMTVAHLTRKDFSFLGGMLKWGFFLALALIASSLIFGMKLGSWFSVLMIGFAGAAVLWDTSNIIRHYHKEQYVAAAMALFASIAMMFWYILRFMIGNRE